MAEELAELAFEGLDKIIDIGFEPTWDKTTAWKQKFKDRKANKTQNGVSNNGGLSKTKSNESSKDNGLSKAQTRASSKGDDRLYRTSTWESNDGGSLARSATVGGYGNHRPRYDDCGSKASTRNPDEYSSKRSSRRYDDDDSRRSSRRSSDRKESPRRYSSSRRESSADRDRARKRGSSVRSSSAQRSKDYDRDRRKEQRSFREDPRYPPPSINRSSGGGGGRFVSYPPQPPPPPSGFDGRFPPAQAARR